ncbi:hypothetical protein ACQKNX_08295 [Lysinibacillus sp. NPDC093712]|uniref:hypothetical protein n=1 Tax=Lysinibacillus sp. NPDC093712 TaxID=3390579 RepID=UPI003CFFC60E
MERREYYDIDDNGFILERYLGTFTERYTPDDNLDPTSNYCFETLPQPLLFYKPRWNGLDWEEGESDVEKTIREELLLIESTTPSKEELEDSDFKIKTITLLMEMEII